MVTEIQDHSDNTGGRSVKEAQSVIDAGHPPMAAGTVLVDFDGTVAPFGYLFDFPDPEPGAIETIKAWQDAGLKIIIFTSRLSPLWLESVDQTPFQHIDYIRKYLGNFGIEVEGFTAQKVPAIAYIDDKAYRYENNWDEIREKVLGLVKNGR